MDNITNEQIQEEIGRVVDKLISDAKKDGKKLTRDNIIGMILPKLRYLLNEKGINNEKMWITSGMITGIATVLMIELKLEMAEKPKY